MSVRNVTHSTLLAIGILAGLYCIDSFASSLASTSLARALSWVDSNENNCGGYYLESPLTYSLKNSSNNLIEITSDQTLFSKNGTSTFEGKVSVTREDQQMTANKAVLYRDPQTGKLRTLELIGDVHLREPSTLVVAKEGHFDLVTHEKSLKRILYRTTIRSRLTPAEKKAPVNLTTMRKISQLTAWGSASAIQQNQPNVYHLQQASFSTCPPTNTTWQVKAGKIVLNKNTGRGYAAHAQLRVKNIPIAYFPYINFSIDGQRKSGFLWPVVGLGSSKWGPYLMTPLYWNIAPNYDLLFTPGYLSKRGVMLRNNFRYLTPTSLGSFYVSMIPYDHDFSNFKHYTRLDPSYANPAPQPSSVTQAELNRLFNDSDFRRGIVYRDDSRFNDHWSSHIDFNYASDDYYLRDFGNNLNEVTQNQLLQEGDLYYKSQNWNFIGRLQAYQTLHPVDETQVLNQYRRAPQLILNTDYPDQLLGLEFFNNAEVTHFDIRNTPGANTILPVGNRFHLQPGVAMPLYYSSAVYLIPRFQMALTQYELQQTTSTNTPNSLNRSIPIFDIGTGVTLSRPIQFFHRAFTQTLEPQIYYTYIPYVNQAKVPVFDTTVNTLTYDQMFNYNRFSGIDRIGDANQVGFGFTTRLIDQNTGFEKVRFGVGEILYFANRLVTLCQNDSCTDNPDNHSNYQRTSPLSALLNYNINPAWSITGNAIWNPVSKQMDNTALLFHYQPTPERIINLGFNYVHNGDVLGGLTENTSANNLKLTDISAAWPIFHDVSAIGRLSENWNQHHLQNLLYGVQYDTCCWAVRLVGGKAFTNLDTTNNSPQYNSEFYVQFALKGLGNISSSNPTGALSNITGYNTQFGQEL